MKFKLAFVVKYHASKLNLEGKIKYSGGFYKNFIFSELTKRLRKRR